MSFAVRLTGITKRFGNVTALNAVDLEVESGSIHAIVGENGAGKTTLMRVLYGSWQPNEGSVEVNGVAHQFKNSAQAIATGVGMVSQHYGVIPALSSLENLILGAEGGPVLSPKAAKARAEQLAKQMGFEFDWSAESSTLSPAGAQKLEILKLLWREAKIMILDEPTAMLPPQDADALFESMKKLVAQGATVILVTHRLPEVLQYCSRVTVLRGGKRVAEKLVSETNCEELARLIVGESTLPSTSIRTGGPCTGDVVLDIASVSVLDDRKHTALKSVSFQVKAGEIVGVAGVDGNGQRELFQAIMGVAPLATGTIQLTGDDVSTASTRARIAKGLRVIPEDRHAEAVVEEWSLEWNGALGLQRLAPLSSGAKVDAKARRSWAERVALKFKTKHGGLDLPMSSLSGGNQQRFVAARALEFDPKLVLAFQPARGLDLKGTADVYQAIRDKCGEGLGALVVSFDLDELLEHCDRIVVLNHGVLAEATQRDRQSIGKLMVGA